MKSKFRHSILTTLLLMGMASCGLSSDEEQAIYRYTIKAYYLDGGSRVITMDGYNAPKVRSHRGSYWLETFYQRYGCEVTSEPAACRYDLLNVKDVTEECFNKKIISSRKSGNVTIHKLAKKGEPR